MPRNSIGPIVVAAAALLAVSVASRVGNVALWAAGGNMAFSISSSDFQNGGDIPKKFTCEGADSSPELSWTDPPPRPEALH